MSTIKFKSLLFVSLMGLFASNNSVAGDIESSVFGEIGRTYHIDPHLLYAVALQESNRKSDRRFYVRPHPFTLNSAGRSYYFSDYDAAEKKLLELLKKNKSVDVGIMQINSYWHKDKIPSGKITDLLDPKINVELGAKILKHSLTSSKDPCIAVGHYHSWNDDLAAPYGCKVLRIYRNLVNWETR